MAAQYPHPVFLDATVLSNSASTDAFGFLVDMLESPAVAPAARDEIEHGRTAGHGYLDGAADAFDGRVVNRRRLCTRRRGV